MAAVLGKLASSRPGHGCKYQGTKRKGWGQQRDPPGLGRGMLKELGSSEPHAGAQLLWGPLHINRGLGTGIPEGQHEGGTSGKYD